MPKETFDLRGIAVGAYGPSLLYGVATGAILPVIALTARDLGADLATAALVITLSGIGSLVTNVPATLIATRFGERKALVGAALWCAAAMFLAIAAPTLPVFAAAIFMVGMAGAVFGLARQSYLTEAVPARFRARALSTLGGVTRIGVFLGPFAVALAMSRIGLDGAYWVGGGASLAAAALSWRVPELGAPGRVALTAATPLEAALSPTSDPAAHHAPTVRSIMRHHSRVFLTVGIGVLLIAAVRATRQAVLPLWAESIGLDASATALIYGLSGAIDMLIFYPSGKIMDLRGRRWIAVPCMLIMGTALVLLPFTGSAVGLLLVALLIGFGNGIGSGIVMTLGADFSPSPGRPQFLGIWRLLTDVGTMGGPALLSLVTALVTLSAGIWATGALGFLGAAVLWYWIPRAAPGSAEAAVSKG
ncbi:MFS transporter [Arthrobacter agilis]|uniref:MFS transporter n=1 Tax=Arthrobacter agilis TaxID=37921 RepID=UPI000B34BBE2|nr:MFS transporter [Arthrobacter agilis]OUM42944.1 MFS transporter [Arthrobacter agilis]PPB45890.1 MFS transporter [Arthrobacter agilis]TPV25432.1 MFS transporter [Arthrobacter agilis]VDR33171.1 Arabinose efflux permease [Arthrobacter agilis]